MHATVLRMLSTNSLSAFSSATTTGAVNGQNTVRLVREPVSPVEAVRPAAKGAVPGVIPSVPPPRGSLLNLSV